MYLHHEEIEIPKVPVTTIHESYKYGKITYYSYPNELKIYVTETDEYIKIEYPVLFYTTSIHGTNVLNNGNYAYMTIIYKK